LSQSVDFTEKQKNKKNTHALSLHSSLADLPAKNLIVVLMGNVRRSIESKTSGTATGSLSSLQRTGSASVCEPSPSQVQEIDRAVAEYLLHRSSSNTGFGSALSIPATHRGHPALNPAIAELLGSNSTSASVSLRDALSRDGKRGIANHAPWVDQYQNPNPPWQSSAPAPAQAVRGVPHPPTSPLASMSQGDLEILVAELQSRGAASMGQGDAGSAARDALHHSIGAHVSQWLESSSVAPSQHGKDGRSSERSWQSDEWRSDEFIDDNQGGASRSDT
jgi:hypothetical protein